MSDTQSDKGEEEVPPPSGWARIFLALLMAAGMLGLFLCTMDDAMQPVLREIMLFSSGAFLIGGAYGTLAAVRAPARLSDPPYWIRIPIALCMLGLAGVSLEYSRPGPARLLWPLVAVLAVSALLRPRLGWLAWLTGRASPATHGAMAGLLSALSLALLGGHLTPAYMLPGVDMGFRFVGAAIGAAVLLAELVPRSGAPWTAVLILAHYYFLAVRQTPQGYFTYAALGALDLAFARFWIREILRHWDSQPVDFDESVEAAPAPAAAPRASVGEVKAPVLLGVGSFRVDRERGVKVLAEFQMASGEDCVLAWLRCAVLLGARDIRLEAVPGGFELRFDGAPIPRGQFRDPYGPLFVESESSQEAGRQLAYGLLAASRLRPGRVSLTSGLGADRLSLALRRGEDGSPPEAADKGTETVLRVLWPRWMWPFYSVIRRRCFGRVRGRCGLVEAGLVVAGVAVKTRDLPPDETAPKGPRRRLGISLPQKLHGFPVVRLYRQGILAEAAKLDPKDHGGISFEADVDDDGFALDASQAKVVRNERFHETIGRLPPLLQALILEVARRQAQDHPPVRSAAAQLLVWKDEGRTIWLWKAVQAHLADYGDDKSDPVLAALWDAPLFFALDGCPLSKRALDELYLDFRKIPVAYSRVTGGSGASAQHTVLYPGPEGLAVLKGWYEKVSGPD